MKLCRFALLASLAAILTVTTQAAQAAPKAKKQAAEQQVAQAQPNQPTAPSATEPPKTWDVTLGVAAVAYPTYEGSSELSYLPLPYLDVKWKDQVFLNTFEGLGWNAWKTRNFRVGPILTYSLPGDKPSGANDVAMGLQAGAFAEFAFDYYKLDAKLLQSVMGDSEGQRAEMGIGAGSKINQKFSWFTRLSTTWISENEMKTYFGLNSREASDMTPKQRDYSPGGGLRDVSLSLKGSYDITQHWVVLGEGKYSRLLGDAADSPLVTKFGDANQYTFWMAAAYRF